MGRKAALKMGKGTQKKTLKGVGRSTRAAILSGEELPVEQVVPKMKERGVLKGSLKPNEMIARNEGKIAEFSDEAGTILRDADAKGIKFSPDDISFSAADDFLSQHPFEEGLIAQKNQRLQIIAQEWDGTLEGLNGIKSKLYKVAYSTGTDSRQLDRAIAHDLKTFIEAKAAANLGDDAMKSLKTANAKTGEHLQFFDILENIRLEEAGTAGIVKFLQRAATSPIGLPAFAGAWGAMTGNPAAIGLSALVAGLGSRKGQFVASDILETFGKAVTPFTGTSLPAVAGTIKQMDNQEFLDAMETGWAETFGGELEQEVAPEDIEQNAQEQEGSEEITQRNILWKPVSEADGKLVVLFPTQVGNVQIKDAETGQVLATGRSTGASNGYADTVRFNQPGRNFQNVIIDDGSGAPIYVQDGSRRDANLAAKRGQGGSVTGTTGTKKKLINMRQAPEDIQSAIDEVAQKLGADPLLMQAMVEQESNYNPKAKSSAGAVGLMQLLPDTAAEQAKLMGMEDYDLTDPKDNLKLGWGYFSRMFDLFGDQKLALTAYHSGPGNVQKGNIGPIGRVYADQVLERMEG